MTTTQRRRAAGPFQSGLAPKDGSDPHDGAARGQHFEISQRFFFDAAHTLKRDIEAEGSRRIHGHTYNAEITLGGTPDPQTGMVVDLGLVRQAIEQLRPQLDHHLLDEVPDLGVPTLENLCAFIHARIGATVPDVAAVTVERRSSGDRCTYRP